MSNRSIAHVAVVVEDYDAAIEFYTQKLGFYLVEDTPIPEQNKRWVVVAPEQGAGCSILLARAANDKQRQVVGQQTGGRVFLFLRTDDFWLDYQSLLDHQVEIVRPPKKYDYGTVAVFADLYGNQWDLIEYKTNLLGASG